MRKLWTNIKKHFEWYWVIVSVMMIIGLSMICYNQINDFIIGNYQPSISQIKKSKQSKANFNYSDTKNLTMSEVIKSRANASKIHTIGVIAVPGVGLSIPIGEGVGNNVLALGAGTMRAGEKMGVGNYALAGHNMAHNSNVLFTPLFYKGKIGMKVYLTDFKKVYTYKICETQTVDPSRVDLTYDTPNQNIVTLIMCNESGDKRVYFRGRLIKTQNINKVRPKIQKDLKSAYKE